MVGFPRVIVQLFLPHSITWLASINPLPQPYTVTAICVSTDRSQQDTASTHCLPFGRVGARHPAMTHGASPTNTCPRRHANPPRTADDPQEVNKTGLPDC